MPGLKARTNATTPVTAKSIGNTAEDIATAYLKRHGYAIVERNWRTRYCEIDIIATRGGTYYFVEVKYRSSRWQGGGLAAITPKKLRQMEFAAELYMARNQQAVATTGGVRQGYGAVLVVVAIDAKNTVCFIEIT